MVKEKKSYKMFTESGDQKYTLFGEYANKKDTMHFKIDAIGDTVYIVFSKKTEEIKDKDGKTTTK